MLGAALSVAVLLTIPASMKTTTTVAAAAGVWKSGASGSGVASGAFGTWRGTPVAIAGTWNDDYDAQIYQWSLRPGAEFGDWQGDIDVAIGAIFNNRHETWAKAAAGAYDARWTRALRNIARYWGDKPGTVHIRFAHEFNGDWVPWKVTGAQAVHFRTAWRRFRALQRRIMPAAKLVFCPNDGTSRSLKLDWRKAFPGAAYVDEMGVDSYNQDPYVADRIRFAKKIYGRDGRGAPRGIERHRQYAASVGLPLVISEWNSNASLGDGATYMRLFRNWVASHAGNGAGRVPYEIVFNVPSYGSGQFGLYPRTKMPKAAAAYRAAF